MPQKKLTCLNGEVALPNDAVVLWARGLHGWRGKGDCSRRLPGQRWATGGLRAVQPECTAGSHHLRMPAVHVKQLQLCRPQLVRYDRREPLVQRVAELRILFALLTQTRTVEGNSPG